MELHLKEYQRKSSPGEKISTNQPTRLQEQLHLDIDSDFNDDDCNDIVALVAAVERNCSNEGFVLVSCNSF